MGLFSSKKVVSIDSATYNLAGDYKDRELFYQPNIIGSTFRTDEMRSTTSDRIFNNYLFGSGVKLRNTYKWLRRKDYWNLTGQLRASFSVGSNIDTELIINNIPKIDPNETISIIDVDINYPNLATWASKWIIDNNPEYLDYDWTVESSEQNDTHMTIKLPEINDRLTGGEYTILLENYDLNKRYLSVYFQRVYGSNEVDKIEEDDYETEEYPDMSNWILNNNEVTPKEFKLINSIYKDGELVERTELIEERNELITTYLLDEYINTVLYKRKHIISTTYEVKEEIIEYEEEGVHYKEVNQKLYTVIHVEELNEIYNSYYAKPIELILYKQGSGNSEFDSLFSTEQSAGNIFPILPIRVNKRNVSSTFYNGVYEANKKMLKLSIDADYDDIVKDINKSPSIGDINHCFMRIGIPINTKDYGGKEYLYRFFKEIELNSKTPPNIVDDFIKKWNDAYQKNYIELSNWANASVYTRGDKPPKYGSTPYPSMINTRTGSITQLGWAFEFNVQTTWMAVQSSIHRGSNGSKDTVASRPGRNIKLNTVSLVERCTGKEENNCKMVIQINPGYPIFSVIFDKQLSRDNYERIEVFNLVQNNHVHAGHGETYDSYKEFEKNDDSELVIPLSINLFNKVSIHNFTQASTSAFNITFNSYKISKIKWYQKDWFRVVIVVVAIVVSIYFPPAGAGIGATTSSVAIGTAIGLTGAAALAVGALIKLAVSVVLSRILTAIFTKLFGDMLGSILAVMASMVAGQAMNNWAQGMDMMSNMNSLMSMGNLFSLTTSVFNQYGNSMNSKMMGNIQSQQDILNQYNNALDELNDKMDLLNVSSRALDPIRATRETNNEILYEKPEVFLTRTLLVGSDIVEMNLAMIDRYTSLTMKLGDN